MKDKKYRKDRNDCHYTGGYRGATHSICNLKYSVLKKIPIALHYVSNYDHHFIIKELAEEFKKQFAVLGENIEKYITFTALVEKKVTRIAKNGEKITKKYLTYYNLLTGQDLWQAHYQILLIMFLKEFIKLNVNDDKNVTFSELNISIATTFFNK